MRRQAVFVGVFFLLFGLGCIPCMGQQSSFRRLSERTVESFVVRDVSRLDALLRLGQQSGVPLGIEYVDGEALTSRIRITLRGGNVGAVLDRIIPRSRGYHWREEGGVIVVSHRSVPRGNRNLLSTKIPKFEAGPATVPELSNLLRMELELALNPRIGGFAGSFPTEPNQRKIGPFRVDNRTVRDLLNLLVSSSSRSAWIVQAPADQMHVIQPQGLWGIVSYASPPKPLADLCCVRLDAFQAKERHTRKHQPIRGKRSVRFEPRERAAVREAVALLLSGAAVPGGIASVEGCEVEPTQTLEGKEASLRDALDSLMVSYPSYRWIIEDRVVNVLPARASPALLETETRLPRD